MYENWEIGQKIDGLYEIFGASAGGMGAVYFVNHLKWKIPLAVKTPLLTLINSPSAYRRYIKEAETWINIGMHPHIVSCFYVRELDGIPRIFIEYVSGGTLKDLIDKKLLGDISYILDLAIQFSMAMEYVHDLGIIHRDIKPANCMITSDGELKVTDFGIAKLGDDVPDTDNNPHFASSYEGLTMTGTGFGTPEYMAPEQFLDAKNIGKEADIYSFGIMLYEMVCGSRPFVMPTGMNAQARDYFYRDAHFNEIPRQPVEINRHTPLSLNHLILKCLEKDVSKRFRGFDQISAMLSDCCKETGKPNKRIKPDVLKLKADSLNNKAISLLDLGKFDGAVRCWRQSLAEDPQHLEATFNFGYYRWKEGALYRDVLRSQMANLKSIHEDNVEFWQLLTWLYYEVGDIAALDGIQNSSYRVADPKLLKVYNELSTRGNRWVSVFKGDGSYRYDVSALAVSPDGKYVLSAGLRVRLWEIESGMEIRCYEGHKTRVNSIAFSSDGRYIISGSGNNSQYSDNGTIILWDVNTGAEIRRFDAHCKYEDAVVFPQKGESAKKCYRNFSTTVSSVGFSPDGRFVVTSVNFSQYGFVQPEGEIIIDQESCKATCIITHPNIETDDSPDENTIVIWGVATGKEIRRFIGHESRIKAVTFSPDGEYVLSGSHKTDKSDENTLRLWDLATGKDLKRFIGHYESINTVAFSPDGRYVVSGHSTVRLWETSTGNELRLFEGHSGAVLSVIFSPDSQYVLSGGIDHSVRLWDIVAGNELWRFEGHSKNVESVVFTPDGEYVLSASDDQTIWLCSWKNLKRATDLGLYPAISRIRQTAEVFTETREVQHLLISVTASIANFAYKEAFNLLRHIQTIHGYEKNKHVLDLINFCAIKGQAIRKSFRFGWHTATYKGHCASVMSVVFSPDGQYVLSGSGDEYDYLEDNSLILWEAVTGNVIRCFEGQRGSVNTVAFSPDGKFVLSGGGSTDDETDDDSDDSSDFSALTLWEVATGNEIKRFEGHCSPVKAVAFSPDSKYVVSGGWDDFLILWEVQTGKELKRFVWDDGDARGVEFSPDGKYIISGGHNSPILWDVATGKEIRRFMWDKNYVYSIAISPDGRYLLTGGSDLSARLWDIETGKTIRRFEGHAGYISSVAFSPDSKFAVTGSNDGTVRVWNVSSGHELGKIVSRACSINFSSDGRHLLFATNGNVFVLWELDWEWEFPEGSK